MAAIGSGDLYLGPRHGFASLVGWPVSSFSMAAANAGWAARFVAQDTRDIKSVHVNFLAVSTPGTVEARIETIDATTGKPTGTLYDVAATKTFTPTADWNTVTFDTLPTAGMTAGTMYALLLLKTSTGTTCNIRSRISSTFPGHFPANCFTAADATTRSNLTTQTSPPICYFTMDDDVVETLGCATLTTFTTENVYGADRVVAQKIITPFSGVVRGIWMEGLGLTKNGTPAGDLRVRLLNSSNTELITASVDKDIIETSTGLYLPVTNTSLSAGTYRIAFDSASSVDNSNSWGIRYSTLPNSVLMSSAYSLSVSTNQSTSFTWTDYNTRQAAIGLHYDSVTGGGGLLTHPGMSGRVIY